MSGVRNCARATILRSRYFCVGWSETRGFERPRSAVGGALSGDRIDRNGRRGHAPTAVLGSAEKFLRLAAAEPGALFTKAGTMLDVEEISAAGATDSGAGATASTSRALRPHPNLLTVEITTRCNLTCVMCIHGSPGGMPNARDLPHETLELVLEELDHFSFIRPTGVGEPLMAPGFWTIVDRLHGRKNPRLTFVTNGILLTQENVDRLAGCPLQVVNVSVDAARPDMYYKIRGGSMEKTIKGISRLVAMNLARPKWERGIIKLSMVLTKSNVEQVPEFIELAHNLGVGHVHFQHLSPPLTGYGSRVVKRGDYTFDYHDEWLINHPEFSDRWMLEGYEVANRLDMKVLGFGLLLGKENVNREYDFACRKGTDAFLFYED